MIARSLAEDPDIIFAKPEATVGLDYLPELLRQIDRITSTSTCSIGSCITTTLKEIAEKNGPFSLHSRREGESWHKDERYYHTGSSG